MIRDIGDAKLHSEVMARLGTTHPVLRYELTARDRPGYLPAQTNNADRADDHALHARFDQYPLNTRVHWHQYSTFKGKYGGEYLPEKMLTTVIWGRAHYAAYVNHLASKLNIVVPQVFQKEACDRVLRASELQPNTSKGQFAKELLGKILPKVGDDVTKITPDLYRTMLQNGECDELRMMYLEWALELHTDELLHELLSEPDSLANINPLPD